jgi:hypothetical protein
MQAVNWYCKLNDNIKFVRAYFHLRDHSLSQLWTSLLDTNLAIFVKICVNNSLEFVSAGYF